MKQNIQALPAHSSIDSHPQDKAQEARKDTELPRPHLVGGEAEVPLRGGKDVPLGRRRGRVQRSLDRLGGREHAAEAERSKRGRGQVPGRR